MRRIPIAALMALVVVSGLCRGGYAQVGGNANYGGGGGAKAQARQNEQRKRALTPQELPPNDTSTYVDASVLMNVKADEYVAVFAIAQEAPTVSECGQKMGATIKAFTDRVKALGVTGSDSIYVDFVAQNKVYDFEVVGDIAKEKLTGFELKKNVAIRYSDPKLLDKLVVAASESEVYDLIKVDYVVRDIDRIQARLVEEAARIVKQKAARYEQLLGVKFTGAPQIYVERPAVYYPATMYDSYTAFEAESMSSAAYRQKYTIQSARKTRTFHYNGLDADGFDLVINPVTVEPLVQCTLYLKVRYDGGKEAASPAGK